MGSMDFATTPTYSFADNARLGGHVLWPIAMMQERRSNRVAAWPPLSPARFVPLEGRNHAMLAGEPALRRYLDEVGEFLRS